MLSPMVAILKVIQSYLTFKSQQDNMPTQELLATKLYTVVSKNDTDVAHYNFNAHQPI